jgi:hypothetical protein
MGHTPLDVLSIQTLVKRERGVETIQQGICFFPKSTSPGFFGHAKILVKETLVVSCPWPVAKKQMLDTGCSIKAKNELATDPHRQAQTNYSMTLADEISRCALFE